MEGINSSIERKDWSNKEFKANPVSPSLHLYLHKKCHVSKKGIRRERGRRMRRRRRRKRRKRRKDLLVVVAAAAAEKTKPIVN
jgi:hypothetical protein